MRLVCPLKEAANEAASLFRIQVIATYLNWAETLTNILLLISVLFKQSILPAPSRSLDAQEFCIAPFGLA